MMYRTENPVWERWKDQRRERRHSKAAETQQRTQWFPTQIPEQHELVRNAMLVHLRLRGRLQVTANGQSGDLFIPASLNVTVIKSENQLCVRQDVWGEGGGESGLGVSTVFHEHVTVSHPGHRSSHIHGERERERVRWGFGREEVGYGLFLVKVECG